MKPVTSCRDTLEKYKRLPNYNPDYVKEVTTVLMEATNWSLMIEGLYSKMEIYSINNTKGDTSSIGVFTDNSSRTIYKFIQELKWQSWAEGITSKEGISLKPSLIKWDQGQNSR